jgi:hypothetical protein
LPEAVRRCKYTIMEMTTLTEPHPQHLQIAPNLTLPLQAVTQTFAILGMRGSGKTYTAKVFGEELLKANLHTAVMDPTGVWYGLRSSPDGKDAGLPILLIGGRRRDGVPMDIEVLPTQGAMVAEMLVEHGLSAILDLKAFKREEKIAFCKDFCARLLEINQDPLHLILDEADIFAPKAPMYKGAADALVTVTDIAQQGRVYGIGLTVISQRPQLVHNTLLSLVETLILLRMIGSNDLAAIDSWIGGNATKDERAKVLARVMTLEVGEACVWSPAWLKLLSFVHIRTAETFDSSKTPEAGQTATRPQAFAELDKEALAARFAETLKEAALEDPVALRKEIEDLRRQLRDRPKETVEKIVEKEVPVLSDNALATLREALDTANVLGKELGNFTGLINSLVKAGTVGNIQMVETVEAEETEHASPVSLPAPPPVRRSNTSAPPPPPTSKPAAPASGLSRPQQAILDALATFEGLGVTGPVARSNVAAWAGQSPRSSGYDKNLSTLRSGGYIEYPTGKTALLTAKGRDVANRLSAFTSRRDLLVAWQHQVSGPQGRMLKYLCIVYPEAARRVDIARGTDQSPSSSGFDKNLSTLRSYGLVDYPNGQTAVATDLLFPKGLPE